jgi:hypothetical protein
MTVIDATETDRSLTPHALTGGTLAKIIAAAQLRLPIETSRISEQTLSRYVKEQTAPASVKSATVVAFTAMIWTPGSGPAAR